MMKNDYNPEWYEEALDEIDELYAQGKMTLTERRKALFDLNEERREENSNFFRDGI